MNPLAAEWIAKAEADYAGASGLNRRKRPLPDLVCFHCQQCAEKYLKAFLQKSSVAFPKTHVLVDLLNLASTVNAKLTSLNPMVLVLEDFAVKFRYPGFDATTAQARAAMKAIRRIRRAIRKLLGL